MPAADHTLWLQPADAGCAQCPPGSADLGAPCGALRVTRCEQPLLEGEPALLERALQALRTVADDEGDLVQTQRFGALRAADGEVELRLAFARGCGPARLLAEAAFQALRHALPDTDVYVQHAEG